MKEQELLQQSLKEMNELKVSEFKSTAKSKITEIAAKQSEIKKLQERIEVLKKELKALTLEQLDESVLS